jgi:hypothetical protein
VPNLFDYRQHLFVSPRLHSVVDEAIDFFESTPLHPLPPLEIFNGVGVYALYYSGQDQLYRIMGELNHKEYRLPIYIGKAVPTGWRTGRIAIRMESANLRNRLREHARSIKYAANLHTQDFKCRFILLENVEMDLIVPIEAELIRRFRPLWNMIIDGFGNHDPGKGRRDQSPSEWDILHPGRPWVSRLMGIPPDKNDVQKKVQQYMNHLSLS